MYWGQSSSCLRAGFNIHLSMRRCVQHSSYSMSEFIVQVPQAYKMQGITHETNKAMRLLNLMFLLHKTPLNLKNAAHPVHILFHLQYYTLTAATTHTGFEGLVVKDENRLKLGTFHHQMHHRYFECNYGSLEIPWDKLFGSFHDGTEEANERMKERRKQIMGEW